MADCAFSPFFHANPLYQRRREEEEEGAHAATWKDGRRYSIATLPLATCPSLKKEEKEEGMQPEEGGTENYLPHPAAEETMNMAYESLYEEELS
jgi:hypothetical protein